MAKAYRNIIENDEYQRQTEEENNGSAVNQKAEASWRQRLILQQ
jgi:hypothetical protein